MSKSSQRKISMYQQGRADALKYKKWNPNWKCKCKDFMRGWNSVKIKKKEKENESRYSNDSFHNCSRNNINSIYNFWRCIVSYCNKHGGSSCTACALEKQTEEIVKAINSLKEKPVKKKSVLNKIKSYFGGEA